MNPEESIAYPVIVAYRAQPDTRIALRFVRISWWPMGLGDDDYLAREARARKAIDKQLLAAGWVVQSQNALNLNASAGVAVREFTLEKPHGRVDYLLFVHGKAAGVIEAKAEGTTLTEVEHQSGKYVEGLPSWMQPAVYPLPFIYESTGTETRFTNARDPEARSRRVFTFHRPETLAEWARQINEDPSTPTFRARLRAMPPLDERGLWGKQAEAIRNIEESLGEDRPRALIQMATGSGKTFTAATLCYRLIRYAGAKRILFLVDRSNLGRQAKLEFDKFVIAETQRHFPAEYNIQHLTTNTVDSTSRVVLFFDRKPPSERPWTDKLWIYDFRTNQNFTLKTRALVRADLADFVASYNPDNRHERTETERFRAFSYDELTARDKASLDIFWLRDESLEDSENLPAPEVIAAEIVEDLQAALDQFAAIATSLATRGQDPLA